MEALEQVRASPQAEMHLPGRCRLPVSSWKGSPEPNGKDSGALALFLMRGSSRSEQGQLWLPGRWQEVEKALESCCV